MQALAPCVAGCRGFEGPVPPPLWMSAYRGEYTGGCSGWKQVDRIGSPTSEALTRRCQTARDMASHRLAAGLWMGIAAHTIWGLSPIYWNLVDGVAAVEILANRVVWSIPALLVVLAAARRLRSWRAGFRSWRTVALTVAGAALLSVNWGLFLWAVVSERIVEASLGYFMTPLVSVALGVLVLGERLNWSQRVALTVATIGVAGMTIVHGGLPWVSLALAMSFGTYGLLKKLPAATGALESLFGEAAIVAVPCTGYLVVLAAAGSGSLGAGPGITMWLLAAGIVTAAPLWLFGAGVQRIPLSTMGLLQYIAPSLQLLVGVLLYGEVLDAGRLLGFVAIWIALGLVVRDQLSRFRRDIAPAAEEIASLPMSVDPDRLR